VAPLALEVGGSGTLERPECIRWLCAARLLKWEKLDCLALAAEKILKRL
jgi:hypothetical protein